MTILRGISLNSLFFFILLVSFNVLAEPIRGLVIRRGPDSVLVRLVGSSGPPMTLKPVYQSVVAQLNKLKSGDIFQGIGHFRDSDAGERVLMLESLDFVGLRNLLGLWIASNSALVEFLDFDRVRVQIPSAMGLKRYHLTYSLAPANESDWMIFVRDSESVILGSLKLSPRTAVIEFIESKAFPEGSPSIELVRVGK